MKPDEKAASLVLKHLGWVNSNMEHAKKCALIAVDEILNMDYPHSNF